MTVFSAERHFYCKLYKPSSMKCDDGIFGRAPFLLQAAHTQLINLKSRPQLASHFRRNDFPFTRRQKPFQSTEGAVELIVEPAQVRWRTLPKIRAPSIVSWSVVHEPHDELKNVACSLHASTCNEFKTAAWPALANGEPEIAQKAGLESRDECKKVPVSRVDIVAEVAAPPFIPHTSKLPLTDGFHNIRVGRVHEVPQRANEYWGIHQKGNAVQE